MELFCPGSRVSTRDTDTNFREQVCDFTIVQNSKELQKDKLSNAPHHSHKECLG